MSIELAKPSAVVMALLLSIGVPELNLTAVQAADAGGKKPAAEGDTNLKDVQRQWAEASKTLMAYGIERRDQALDQGKKVLGAMDQRIDRLEARATEEWSQLSATARQKRSETLRALRKQRNEVAQWYGGMTQSSADAWTEVRKGFVDAYGSLSDAFVKAAGQFDRDAKAATKR